jgi:voltage-gated sodium channel
MLVILLFNCSTILYSSFVDSNKYTTIFEQIDDIFLYVYITEFLIKLVGLGIEKYYEDNWNKFDFAMIILSILSNILFRFLTILKAAKSAKAGRLLRLAKMNRVLRVCKAARSAKIFRVFIYFFEVL